MKSMPVLISGAGIAGPALALWLSRCGCAVSVVEKASAVRPGGQAVDFKGATHRAVLDRMGVLEEVRRRQTGGRDQAIIDHTGRRLAVVPAEFTSGEVEIRRGDLARLLYERTAGTCRYLVSDSITSLTETADGVRVTFERAEPDTFALVVGADGIHSNVRRLAFGPEEDHVRYLGHYYALADIEVDGDAVMYNEPGRMVAVGGPKAPAFFVFASDAPLQYDRFDVQQQKELLLKAYSGGKWRIPELMTQVLDAGGFFLDSISRVETDRYTKGRIVLLGDAAYGNTLSGFGTGLAIVGAYVLAGELLATNGDHRGAFARYEQQIGTYSRSSKKVNAGPFLAPKTRFKMWTRTLTFKSGFLLGAMLKLTDKFATDIRLDDYPALSGLPSDLAARDVVRQPAEQDD